MIKNWILHVLTALGLYAAYDFGILQHMFINDVTWISTGIILTYFYLSIKITYYWYIGADTIHPIWDQIDFYSNIFLKVGMIGTVIGFLLVFGKAFDNFNIDDKEQVAAIISSMGIGVATALWTTLIGLIASFLLDIQVDNVTDET